LGGDSHGIYGRGPDDSAWSFLFAENAGNCDDIFRLANGPHREDHET
jgi:hypothetical protein